MKGFSIIMPCEKSRFDLLANTLEQYKFFGIPKDVEFIIVSRTIPPRSKGCVSVINYSWSGEFFSTSLPLNIGLRNARYDNIIITSPEVMPLTNVLKQLSGLERDNYICQVYDEDVNGDKTFSLVNSSFRCDNPGMYFLGIFKKEDLFAINGWDEDFMGTYAYEDDDFGHRFIRAGLSFKILDNVVALHQYHPRGYPKDDIGLHNARLRLSYNDSNNIIKPKNGLEKL